MEHINPSTARIFTVFGLLLEDMVLHKGAWVATLLGTHISNTYSLIASKQDQEAGPGSQ